MPHEVAPEPAAWVFDPVPPDELDEIGGLVLVQFVVGDQPELDGRGGDALLEVGGVEAEAMVLKLDDVVVA